MERGWRLWSLAFLFALVLPWIAADTAPEEVRAAAALGETEEPPLVAITFDDGPRRSTTARLLDGLRERGVQATFFLIGELIDGSEDLVERMEAEGHQIGMHSYDHRWLTALNAADFADQVDREREILAEIVGREDFLLRPPYGGVDAGVEKRAGAPIILWSVDPEDWKWQDADLVARHIIDNARDGDIILLHDIYATSVEAALRVVDALHEKGFLFVTVGELAAQRHVELRDGEVYREFYP